jgi:tetratricopeptide (TPR) repeat protein
MSLLGFDCDCGDALDSSIERWGTGVCFEYMEQGEHWSTFSGCDGYYAHPKAKLTPGQDGTGTRVKLSRYVKPWVEALRGLGFGWEPDTKTNFHPTLTVRATVDSLLRTDVFLRDHLQFSGSGSDVAEQQEKQRRARALQNALAALEQQALYAEQQSTCPVCGKYDISDSESDDPYIGDDYLCDCVECDVCEVQCALEDNFEGLCRECSGDQEFEMGVECRDGDKPNEVLAVKHFREGADYFKNAESQHALGKCYHDGRGVSQNYPEAVKYFREAAEQHHIHAQHELGRCFELGTGIDRDFVEAAKWYRSAAKQGDADSQFRLGMMYRDGKGLEKDEAVALDWCRKAAAQGNGDAQAEVDKMVAPAQSRTNAVLDGVKKPERCSAITKTGRRCRRAANACPAHRLGHAGQILTNMAPILESDPQ